MSTREKHDTNKPEFRTDHGRGNDPGYKPVRKILTKKITFGGLLLAIAIVLPQFFHLTGGPAAGAIFLPMHIPVLIAGFILGPVFGLVIGMLSPMISFFLTGMPVAARLPFMVAELAIYGASTGLFYHVFGLYHFRYFARKKDATTVSKSQTTGEKFAGIYLSLLAAMIAGRTVYALGLIVMGNLFGIKGANPAAVLTAITTGLIGIFIQFAVIAPIIFALQKGGQTDGFIGRSKE